MSNSKSAFDGRCILVTGSTRGIGRAVAQYLHDHGATVGIHGRAQVTVDDVAAQLGERALALPADLEQATAAADLVESFAERAGRIDGLVNNAGGGGPTPFRGLTLDQWRDTFKVNLESAMLAAQAAYLRMRKQRSGSIVNVASISAHGAGGWMGADYAASKAGLVSLTKSLALEGARFGVRCNAVSPGFVETDMTKDIPQVNRKALRIPLGRLAEAGEVASVVAFLLGSESSYMTGQILHVDGGLYLNG